MSGRSPVLNLSVCALISFLISCSGSPDTQQTATGTAGTATTPAVTPPTPAPSTPAADPTPRYGIAVGDTLRWLADPIPSKRAELDRQLNDIGQLGVGWVRLDFPWTIIQPESRDRFWWNSMDVVVDAVSARGLNVLGILAYTPQWARAASCTKFMCQPQNADDYAAFARAAAERYARKGVHTWEIWNEPNLMAFWQPAPNPTLYAQMVIKASQAIRAVDPQAKIIVGGLGPGDVQVGDQTSTDFLRQVYAEAKRLTTAQDQPWQGFDAVSYHAYSYPLMANDPHTYNPWKQIEEGQPSIYDVMSTYGDGDKSIWITEYGAPSMRQVTSTLKNSAGLPIISSDEQQAEMMKTVIAQVEASPHIGKFFWYSYKDLGTADDNVENFFGLTDYYGNHKPAYTTFQTLLSGLQ